MQVFITQLQLMEKEENDYLDEKKFKEKQLFLKKLMRLKKKGKYLEETNFFIESVKATPSGKSQYAVVSQFLY